METITRSSESGKDRAKWQQRSLSMQQDPSPGGGTFLQIQKQLSLIKSGAVPQICSSMEKPPSPPIDIQVTQPTPNLSPSCSLRSISCEGSQPSPQAILSALESKLEKKSAPSSELSTSSLDGQAGSTPRNSPSLKSN